MTHDDRRRGLVDLDRLPGKSPVTRWIAMAFAACLAAGPMGTPLAAQNPSTPSGVDLVFDAVDRDDARASAARARMAANWDERYVSMLVDVLAMTRRTGLVDPFSWIRLSRVAQFLEERTGQHFGGDTDAWRSWIWSRPYTPHPDYGAFKARLYGELDPAFDTFFRPPVTSTIRLDEVDWGGVVVNGIPPLDHPKHVEAAKATYLDPDNVVFGLWVDGVARAYPQRILAWHELARDTLGTRDVTLVYCTLCGTVIPYDSRTGGLLRKFGTSGLLYQSNKLMFDEATHSLWSSLDGTPVVGPLVGSGLHLTVLPVVTTTWGEWRRLHADTTVLSLDTGYRRDYSEGAAYRQYFATDALMFPVSRYDPRLRNKAEILVVRMPAQASADARPVAISDDFLRRHPVYHLDTAGMHLVVITSKTGANRVYDAGNRKLVSLTSDGHVLDAEGRSWSVTEDALQAASDASMRMPRVPAHRAFWFGWYAQHPDTMLVK